MCATCHRLCFPTRHSPPSSIHSRRKHDSDISAFVWSFTRQMMFILFTTNTNEWSRPPRLHQTLLQFPFLKVLLKFIKDGMEQFGRFVCDATHKSRISLAINIGVRYPSHNRADCFRFFGFLLPFDIANRTILVWNTLNLEFVQHGIEHEPLLRLSAYASIQESIHRGYSIACWIDRRPN